MIRMFCLVHRFILHNEDNNSQMVIIDMTKVHVIFRTNMFKEKENKFALLSRLSIPGWYFDRIEFPKKFKDIIIIGNIITFIH